MMIPSLVTTVLALAASAAAAPGLAKRGCGTKTDNTVAAFNLAAANLEVANAKAGVMQSAATIYVDTYFHVVAASEDPDDGYIPQSQLTDQLAAMNKAFLPHGIQFKLIKSDWTINSTWAMDGDEMAMKRKLRQGSYKSLNLYFQKQLDEDAMGYCYFPQKTPKTGSAKFVRDGCSINGATVPGGSYEGYNLGLTAVHETGHWFGLMHTFQGLKCTGAGDMIGDTPQQLSPTSGCPASRDSCPTKPGLDPIHNYMDYSSDECYEQFTQGQRQRMLTMWNMYRKNAKAKA